MYRKYAKFTQNTQILHTKNEKPCLNYPNFMQILRKIYAKCTQNVRKMYANYAKFTQIFLRSYTKILSGQPLGSQYWQTDQL